MATTATAGPARIDDDLVKELREVSTKISDATNALDDLQRGERFRDPTQPRETEVAWLLQGFTMEMIEDVRAMVRAALALRDWAMGGLVQDELDLLHAAGGSH